MRTRTFPLVFCVSTFFVAGHVEAGEKKVDVKDLPKAVVDVVKAKYPKAEIEKAFVDDEDGKQTFEVEIENSEEELTLSVSAEGKILEVEKEVAVKDLPKAVVDAIKAKYPKADIEEAEIVVADGNEFYEVAIETSDDKEYEVVLDKSGKILKTEEIKEDEEN